MDPSHSGSSSRTDPTCSDDGKQTGNESAAATKARQMRGLQRRKKKFTRTLRGPSGKDQKDSDFNYHAYRTTHDSNMNLNSQQVRAAIAPIKTWSPISKVRRERLALRTSLQVSKKKRKLLDEKVVHNNQTIANLKARNSQLLQDIL